MSAPMDRGSFAAERADLRAARDRIDAMDRVLRLMQELADRLQAAGEAPGLALDPATGLAVLHVHVGTVPPRVSVVFDDAPAVVAPKPTLGDLSDAVQGLGGIELPRPVMTETIKLPPACAPEADEAPPRAAAPTVACRVPPGKAAEATVSADAMTADTSDGRCAAEGARPAAGGSPAPAPQRPRHKTGEWTADEERRLLEMHDAGQLLPDMVGDLGRAGPGIAAKLGHLLAKRTPPADVAPAPAPVAPPPPGPAAPPPAAGPILPPGAGVSRLEREAAARLAEVQDPEWPPARDQDLLERMMRGEGAGGTAEAMGIEKPQVLARWRALFPAPPTIDEQAAMLAVLKRVAA